ncbi:unnamed protein product, partial [Hapterophycus canaliculatus]
MRALYPISVLEKKGRWQTALNLLAEIPSTGLEPNAHVYGSAIHACVTAGQGARALALLGEMLERRVVPDAATYNAALSVVARSGREDVALALLKQMEADG